MKIGSIAEHLWPLWLATQRSLRRSPHARAEGALGALARESAQELARAAHGWDHLVASAAQTQEGLVLEQLTPLLCLLVAGTDLRSCPQAAPAALLRPWVVEVAPPATLWGDTFALGGYSHDGALQLCGVTTEGATLRCAWTPPWAPFARPLRDSEELLGPEDFRRWSAWGQQAARWALIYGLLRSVEPALLEERGSVQGPPSGAAPWTQQLAAKSFSRKILVPPEHFASLPRFVLYELPPGQALASLSFSRGRHRASWRWKQALTERRWCAPTPGRLGVR